MAGEPPCQSLTLSIDQFRLTSRNMGRPYIRLRSIGGSHQARIHSGRFSFFLALAAMFSYSTPHPPRTADTSFYDMPSYPSLTFDNYQDQTELHSYEPSFYFEPEFPTSQQGVYPSSTLRHTVAFAPLRTPLAVIQSPIGAYEEGPRFCPPNMTPSLTMSMRSYTNDTSLPTTTTQTELPLVMDFQ